MFQVNLINDEAVVQHGFTSYVCALAYADQEAGNHKWSLVQVEDDHGNKIYDAITGKYYRGTN